MAPALECSGRAFRYHEKKFMETTESVTDMAFVVKEDGEHCFLFDSDDPLGFLRSLLAHAEKPGSGLSREEAYEVMEGMVPERLRSI